jgi:hypothetical protein
MSNVTGGAEIGCHLRSVESGGELCLVREASAFVEALKKDFPNVRIIAQSDLD